MQLASFAVNSGVGQIASTASNNYFVPLNLRAPQTQTQSTSGPCQGAIPTDSSQKTNRPETVPITSKPDLIITDQATLPQVPPASSFIPEPQRNFSQAPRNSALPPGGEPRRAKPNFVQMERATLSQVPLTSKFFPQPQATFFQAPPTSSRVPPSWGPSYQVPPHHNANIRQQDAWYQTPPQPNVNTGTQGTWFQMGAQDPNIPHTKCLLTQMWAQDPKRCHTL
jgi:hypothetical protein